MQRHYESNTLYLIRVNEFRCDGKAKNTDNQQREIREGKLLSQSLHESHWWNVNKRRQGGRMSQNGAFIAFKYNYLAVFVQIRLLSRGPDPAAVC